MVLDARPFGPTIRYLRKIRQISQKSLAEGVCSIRHLQSIEVGKSNPTPFIFERLLIKLGENPAKYLYNFTNVCEQRTFKAIQHIQSLISDFKYAEANESFQHFIKSEYSEHDFVRQFVLWCESVFLHELHNDNNAALEKANQAINITINNFTVETINQYVFSMEESLILNWLSLIYLALDEFDKGISILEILRQSFSENYTSDALKTEVLPIVCCNLSKYYGLKGKLSEGLEVCNYGIEVSRKYKHFVALGRIFYNRSCIYNWLGEPEKAQTDFNSSISCFDLLNDTEMISAIKRNIIEKHGVSLT